MIKKRGIMRLLVAGRSLLGGIAGAAFLFLASHRFDLVMGSQFRSIPLLFLALLAGWGVGVWLLRGMNISLLRSRTFGGVLIAVASGLVVFPLTADVAQIFLFTAAGSAAVALLWERSFAASDMSVGAFVSGFVIGCLALAWGVAGLVGLRVLMIAGCGPGAFLGLIGPGRAGGRSDREAIQVSRHAHLANLFLSVSSILLVVALVRVHSYGPTWMAFSLVDLGVAFGAGLLLRYLLPVSGQPSSGGLIARALGLMGVALVVGWSFVFHPYLIFSEPATMQSSPHLLDATRTFPLWGMAFAMAFLVPEIPGRRILPSGRGTLVCILGLAALFVMPPAAALYWNYLLAGFFAVCGVMLAVTMAWSGAEQKVEKVFPVAAGLCAIGGIMWMALVPQMAGWQALRFSFAWYQQDVAARFNAPQPPQLKPGRPAAARATGCRMSDSGLEVRIRLNGETGVFHKGALVWSSRSQDSASVSVLTGMLAAAADQTDRVAALTPVLEPTNEALRTFLPGTQLVRVSPRSLLAGKGWISAPSLDAMVLGPGAMSGTRPSGIVLNRELLTNARRWIRDGGVLATWVSTRGSELPDLINALQTVRSVFPGTVVFQIRDEMVLLSRVNKAGMGGGQTRKQEAGNRIEYGSVQASFLRPKTDAFLSATGYWDPRQFVGTMATGVQGLAEMSQDGEVTSIWRPRRGMVMPRDLARPSNPVLLALLTQHRLAWRDRLIEALDFSSKTERKLAAFGLKKMYKAATRELLRWIGEACRKGGGAANKTDRLVSLLKSPRGRLELLAPDVENGQLRLPVALYRFGLYARAMEELSQQQGTDGNKFSLYYWRGRCLEKLGRQQDALRAYETAHDIREEDVSVILRMANIELGRRRFEAARKHLQRGIELAPENVSALVRLSFINGQMGNYKRAVDLAERALQLDPDNAAARDQRVLYRWKMKSNLPRK